MSKNDAVWKSSVAPFPCQKCGKTINMYMYHILPKRISHGEYVWSEEHGKKIYVRDDEFRYYHLECCYQHLPYHYTYQWPSDENRVPTLTEEQKRTLDKKANDNEIILE